MFPEEMMKIRRMLPILSILFLTLGCNLPTAPQSEAVPPFDQTMTALFETAAALPPSETPPLASPTSVSTPKVATVTPPVDATPVGTITVTLSNPTNTPPPTNTPIPPTATMPSGRAGLNVEAVRWSGSGPTLDGDWSEWKSVAREYPATYVVYGEDEWDGEDDLAGSFYTGWNSDYLFVAAKVRDDRYVQNATEKNIFKGDSLELLFDTNLLGDFYDDSLSGDDFQLGISAGRPTIGDGNAEAYLWYPAGKAGPATGVKIAARDEGDQYRVEIAVPWSLLGVTPRSGMRLGFAFSVSDNDLSGESVQESMVSSAADRYLTDPTGWHDLILQ
jgi:hypothetical protein